MHESHTYRTRRECFRRWHRIPAATVLALSLSAPPALAAEGGAGSGGQPGAGLPSAAVARAIHGHLVEHVAAERWQAAEGALERARERLPRSHVLLLRLEGWHALQRGRNRQAIDFYERLLQRLPGDAEAAVNLAYLHLERAQPEKARRVLDEALEHEPRSARLRQAYQRLDR